MKLLLVLLLASPLYAAFVPDFKLRPDDYTILMAVDAKLSDGLKPFQSGGHGKFFIQGWQHPDQQVEWKINAGEAAEYAVNVLVHNKGSKELRIEVAVAGNNLTGVLPAAGNQWQRIALSGIATIPKGDFSVNLRLIPADGSNAFDAEVHAVEFIRPDVRTALDQRALAMRADTTWFKEAGYGVIVHWTKQSMPRNGDPKPYDQAVSDFDVEAFAGQMQLTGAGFVVLTTSHAFQNFPAPITSLDRIIPGRTSKRDLVADLADALGRHGMKLMLYFHPGASDDAEWLKASGFWETDTTRFFGNWQAIISEVGWRYKDKLAGWWFDDGSTSYYYRSAPWEKLNHAAKAGFSQRLVGFNAWELNNPTLFHDYFTGEGLQDPRGYNGLLVRNGNGRYPSGTHQGLQSSACLMVEDDWVHRGKNTPIAAPRWKPEQLAPMLLEFAAYRNVPIFNLEIYQEGTVSPMTVEFFRNAGKLARTMK